ncbi:uncharacterized protein LOC109709946 [Ananas comosus]|uniref:Uncharacterized protein LOC109709946 n=2 Tax=Ananas comosus TaxID=4615 RepID=A0A6P5F385_ANACO|nr:uncharacterized protein LOC109709946 [Ananas comosus]
MEQFRQIGELLGSLNALMVFKDNIQINRRQCLLLVEAFTLAFEGIAEEMKWNLKFNEKSSKWHSLESPLRELHRIFKEGEQYVRQCIETKDWWAKALSLNQSTDCVDFHLHNLLWCVPVVLEAIENVSEISGCDQEAIHKKRVMLAKKYDRDWLDPQLFQHKFGERYLVSKDMRSKLDSVWKEDQWILSEIVTAKPENQPLAEVLLAPKGKVLPSSILVGSKDYQVRRRLGNGGHYKEIQWMGESFAVRHLFADIEQLRHEISLLSSIRHPNLMHIMHTFFDEERKECFLVMELMNKDLSSHIKEICSAKRRLPFPLLVAVDIMLQIARGMEYLHSRKIYHGDLNPSNVLVKSRTTTSDGYLHVKITGFGTSGSKDIRAPTNHTTAAAAAAAATAASTSPCIWYAPEVLTEQEQSPDNGAAKYREKADVYSFAMICFELLTGKVPFEDEHLQGDKTSRNIRAGVRPLFPFPSPKYLTNLTKKCWQADPSQRPSFSAICRVLRYMKRFLILNPDHNQLDLPTPTVDYFDLETSLCKRFATWGTTDALKVSEIPFQLFGYRVTERERASLNLKEKSSESGSEGASICGEENGFGLNIHEDPFPSPVGSARAPPLQVNCETTKKATTKKTDAKAKTPNGHAQKGRVVRPPQRTLCSRSLRINSESRIRMSQAIRRLSGHASDSELA